MKKPDPQLLALVDRIHADLEACLRGFLGDPITQPLMHTVSFSTRRGDFIIQITATPKTQSTAD